MSARLVITLVMGVVLLPFGGCATIINGTTQDVSVSSDPEGARVTVDGNPIGVTPIVLNLKRKNNHVITVARDGYHTEQVSIQKVMSGAVAGNILAGGLIGWGIDASSGSQYKLKPDTVTVAMRPLAPGEVDQAIATGQPSVEDRLRQLDRLKKDGVVTESEYASTKAELLKELKSAAKEPPPPPATAVPAPKVASSDPKPGSEKPQAQTADPQSLQSSWITGRVDHR